jgi:hypothetical protein
MINRGRKEWIDKARDVAIENEIARRGIKLKRITAIEFAGPCPCCGGDDRFSINTKDQVFNCRGCRGKGKGAIDLVMFLDSIRFNDACEKLAGPPPKLNGRGPVRTGTWIYRDAEGRPYLRVSRLDYPDGTKQYPQSRWDGQWVRGKPDGPKIPYRLPELLDSDRTEPVYICEGEKCADAVAALGLAATSASEGAGKWTADLNEWFRDRIAYILPDNDEPGRKHAKLVAQNLAGIAREIRIVELPGLGDGEDAFDWIARRGTREQLDVLGARASVCNLPAAPVATTMATSPGFKKINKDGSPVANWENALVAIQVLGVTCRHDLFHGKYLVGGHIVGNHVGELSDPACSMLRHAILTHFDFDPGVAHTRYAAEQLCLMQPFDPVVDYLNALRWDGKARLETVLIVYFGAADTPLNRAIGPLVFIALVRRAKEPGVKFDEIIVLEGPEGSGKSSALRILAGCDENFSDQHILGLDERAQQEMVQGIWVFELAELTGIRKAEVERVKAFASRTHDKARPAFGHFRVDQPRRCVFFATTNDDDYLQSDTGDRRFWPVPTGFIDIEALKRDRDQLFAEAAALESKGISLRLPRELWGAAKVEQEARRAYDPWLDRLASLQGEIGWTQEGKEERITTGKILTEYLNVPAAQQTAAIAKKLKAVMTRLGWQYKNIREGTEVRKGYCRPVKE